MFKNNWILLCLLAASLAGCRQNSIKDATTKINAPLPGYYGQWLFIKTNGTNVLPDMSRYNWRQNFNKRSISNALVNLFEYGPSNVGGRIRAMIVDKANPARLIVGAVSGGIFISDNSGASWRAINDQALSPSVTGMTQNPFNPAIIYYCTGEAAGNSADLLGAGIFKSTDGGNSFSQLSSTNNTNFLRNWAVKCSPRDTNTLYVLTHSTGLWRSVDAGLTFNRVYSTISELNDLELFPDGSVMFTMKGGGVYRSNSGDVGTFSKISSISSVSTARGEIAFCRNFPLVVYAAISGPDNGYAGKLKAFYKSSDGGKTFTERKNPTDSVDFGFTWYTLTMSVKDDDSNAIFIGSVNIGCSYDGALSWRKGRPQHSDNHSCFNDGNKMYLGSDGGLCYYDWSNFRKYTSLNNGLNITQFYAGDASPNEIAVIGGAQDNGTKEGKDMNNVFSTVFGADGGYCFYHSDSAKVKYYSTQNGEVYRAGKYITKNLPVTTDPKWFIHPYSVSENNGEVLVYPSYRTLYYSTNGGKSYKNIGTVPSGQLFCATISPHANPAVFSGGSSIFMAVDSANNGTTVSKNLRNTMPLGIRNSFLNCIKVIPGYRDRAYLAFSNISDSGRLYVASDLFSTKPVYKNISGNLPVGLPVNWVECDPLDPEKIIFAGTDYGLYVTEDGGETWIKDTRLPSTVISCIKVHKNMKSIYFFTHGRGIFKGQINNAAQEGPTTPSGQTVVIYPNPANKVLNIKLNGTQKGDYSVYDMLGREVMNGRIEGQLTRIDVSSLATANYVIVYKTPSETGKVRLSIYH